MTQPHKIAAKELSGEHISTTIRFLTCDQHTKIDTITTGELREISHTGTDVMVHLGNRFQVDANVQYALPLAHPVVLNPVVFTVDVVELRR